MPIRLLTTLCLLAILPVVAFAASPVEPIEMWSGKIRDESLRKLAPKSGFISDQQIWKKVWTAWQPNQELPKVNFSKELILVGTVSGPNLVIMRPTMDNNGNLKFLVAGTKIGGPGFGYRLLKIDRKEIKSVNGTTVTEETPVAQDSISVKVIGTLKAGIVAIGGETTGTTITAKNITWELDFG
ncbi:MAG: hypothetical protein KDA84_15865 [Planctomycetaceae bacterium]|nr:hypothetical protein [Planctomycetaceae bacterium]